MRALFYCRSKRTKMMADIARSLKDNDRLHKAFAFVAYYDEWRSYLENRSDVKFEKIVGTKEIYEKMANAKLSVSEIKRIEREYGSLDIEIMNLIMGESYLTSHTHSRPYNHPKYSWHDMMLYIQIVFQYIESLFDEIKPDAIIDFAPVNVIRSAMDLIGIRRGIPFLYPSKSLIDDNYHICRRFRDNYNFIRKRYHANMNVEMSCHEGKKFIEDYRFGKKPLYRFHIMDNGDKNKKYLKFKEIIKRNVSIFKNIPREFKLRLRSFSDPRVRYNYQLFKNLPSIEFYRKCVYAARKVSMFLNSPFKSEYPKKKYAFLTLHYQPEASTTVLSPYFVDQKYVIDCITRSLPLDWILVVKPHPLMVGNEPVSFYRWINKIPNTILVSPSCDTTKLIKNSEVVMSITGTSGFEGLINGKNVIVMSDKPIWTMIDGVNVCTDMTKLADMIRNLKDNKVEDKEIYAYTQAVIDSSFRLNKNYIWKGTYNRKDEFYLAAIDVISDALYKAYKDFKKDV